MSYLDTKENYSLYLKRLKKVFKVSLALFYRILNIFWYSYDIVRNIARCVYYRAHRRNQENLLKTEVMREGEKLSSIGNYLNRLYDYRKLPPLLRGFRCITVLVAALRKGCCKCKVDTSHFNPFHPFCVTSACLCSRVDQLARIDNTWCRIYQQNSKGRQSVHKCMRHLSIYSYIDMWNINYANFAKFLTK